MNPGRRRSLAPTLSPALFSHPPFTAQCSGYVRCPQPSPISPLSGEKISFLSRPIRCCNALPLQALLGRLFPFLLFPSFSQRFLSKWKQRWFLPAWVSPLPQDLPTTGSHASNGAGLWPLWCRSPIWLPKSHTGPHGLFSFRLTHSLPFPYGERPVCSRIWVVSVC